MLLLCGVKSLTNRMAGGRLTEATLDYSFWREVYHAFKTNVAVWRPTELAALRNLAYGEVKPVDRVFQELRAGLRRHCTACGEPKRLSEFYTSSSHVSRFNPRGYHSRCKPCHIRDVTSGRRRRIARKYKHAA